MHMHACICMRMHACICMRMHAYACICTHAYKKQMSVNTCREVVLAGLREKAKDRMERVETSQRLMIQDIDEHELDGQAVSKLAELKKEAAVTAPSLTGALKEEFKEHVARVEKSSGRCVWLFCAQEVRSLDVLLAAILSAFTSYDGEEKTCLP